MSTYVMGSGTTVGAVMRHLGLENSLLGVDVVRGQCCTGCHSSSCGDCRWPEQACRWRHRWAWLFVRSRNQQISSAVIAKVDTIDILATRTKLAAAANQRLEVDTGDANLDRRLQGIYKVRSGYEDFLLVQVGRRS